MAAIYYGNFTVIESLLSPESISLWTTFGIALTIMWLAGLGYAAFCMTFRRRISVFYCLAVLSIFIPFLYMYATHIHDLIPFRIPLWMMPEDITMYAGTFLMPAMAHALFSLVIVFTRNAHKRKPLRSLLVTILFPVAWYLFYMLVLPLWHSAFDFGYEQHVLITLFIASTVVFLYALVRTFYIISARRDRWGLHWIWRSLVAVILPITGLSVSLVYPVFGDFSHLAFFILAIVTGLTVLLPDSDDKLYRVILFIARSITLSFTLYFFAVFLPYLPLSIVAVIAFGIGFLMLTPLALMIMHCRAIYADIGFLRKFYTSRFIYGLLIAGCATLPLAITWVCLHDKGTLNHALDYVYSPDYHQHRTIDAGSLQRVLNTVEDFKTDIRGSFTNIPFLSSYYNWLVLDHLTLSEAKINSLNRVFNDAPLDIISTVSNNQRLNNEAVHVSAVHTASQYDVKQQVWRSTVELDINNPTNWQSEFATTFTLPTGSWIDSYALWIGNEKTPGILAEKKTATWIYQQITSYRRDPGIVYYLTGNRVALRVFPFEADETRKTSFTLIHKEPVRFTLDNQDITLGEDIPSARPNIEYAGQAVYIPAQIKQSMRSIKRSPRLCFIIDCSEHAAESQSKLIANVESYLTNHKADPETATFILTGTYTERIEGWQATKKALHGHSFEGGFFLELALRQFVISAFEQRAAEYPHIIVVTPDFERAILNEDLADLQWAFPDSDFFFELSSQGSLLPHRLTDQPLHVYTGSMPSLPYAVAAWPGTGHAKAYIRLDTAASIIPGNMEANTAPATLQAHNWSSALALEGAWMNHLIHPERSNKEWLELIRGSFQAQVMTPVTAFLALENEAQRKVLLKKQEDVLNANPNLDVGEETRMSEPGLWLITLLLLAILLIQYRRSLTKQFNTQRSILQRNL